MRGEGYVRGFSQEPGRARGRLVLFLNRTRLGLEYKPRRICSSVEGRMTVQCPFAYSHCLATTDMASGGNDMGTKGDAEIS